MNKYIAILLLAFPGSAFAETIPDYNLTGDYKLSATEVGTSTYFPGIFNRRTKFKFTLIQEEDVVTGRFLAGVIGQINGTLENKKFKFDWYTGRCGDGQGEMTVSSDGLRLDGTWTCKSYSAKGKWTAEKL